MKVGWRVVIVDRADELNQNAANALLKALEEPPPRTLFLLISSAEGRLPVTIRSRARTLRVTGLGEEDLEKAVRAALARDEHEADAKTLATALALGQAACAARSSWCRARASSSMARFSTRSPPCRRSTARGCTGWSTGWPAPPTATASTYTSLYCSD